MLCGLLGTDVMMSSLFTMIRHKFESRVGPRRCHLLQSQQEAEPLPSL